VSTPAASHLEVLREPSPRRVVCSPQGVPVRSNDATADGPVDVNSTRPLPAPTAPSAIEEERAPSRQSEGWSRFCAHCGNPIPRERLVRAVTSRAKVFFCSDLHRFADANAKNKAAKKLRQAKGLCPSCHGRGYTRVNRPQRSSKRLTGAGSEV
jgi:hypothetical protein